ncbi:MAG TPA: hypothetical protein VL737_00590 [Candidatus Pristimantibacillus sp.]|jgi:hypothetical protein|nr:hypothetical protein [Candidatus Pristimantibacillus sp.]
MTEYLSGGGEEQKEDDANGPLGPIGKSVARRERRRDRDEATLARIRGRLDRPVTTEADLRRRHDDLNRQLVLEEQLVASGRDPYSDAAAEAALGAEDPVPEWMRRMWARQATVGGAVMDITSQGPVGRELGAA